MNNRLSFRDPRRADRTPRPDLPALLVFATDALAMQAQRRLHPSEFICLGIGEALLARKFRAIFVTDGGLREIHHRGNYAEIEMAHRWLNDLPLHLAPDCEQQFHYI